MESQRRIFLQHITEAFQISKEDRQQFMQQVKDINDEVPEYFDCSICHCLLYEPQECHQCFKPYCKGCIDQWLTKSDSCPTCRRENMQSKEIHPALMSQLNNLQVKCGNCCPPGREADAEWYTCTYQQLLTIHINDCLTKPPQLCPNGCGQQINSLQSATSHAQECPELLIQCQDCKITLALKFRNNHLGVCTDQRIKCKECNQTFLRKDQATHTLQCPEMSVDCPECKQDFKRKDAEAHQMRCPNRTVSCNACTLEYKLPDIHDCIQSLGQLVKLQEDQIQVLMGQNEQNSKQIISLTNQLQKEQEAKASKFTKICAKIGHDFSEATERECLPNDMQCGICDLVIPGNDEHDWVNSKCMGRVCKTCRKDDEYKKHNWALGECNSLGRKCTNCDLNQGYKLHDWKEGCQQVGRKCFDCNLADDYKEHTFHDEYSERNQRMENRCGVCGVQQQGCAIF